MDAATLQRLAKMLELHRITMLADVVRQERLVASISRELLRLGTILPAHEAALVDGCLRDLAKAAELCGTERESLGEIEKVVRAIRSEPQ
jgi:hypothetical protein